LIFGRQKTAAIIGALGKFSVFTYIMEPSIDTAAAAALIGISPATLRDWKCQRIGPPYIQLSSRCVRYTIKDLEKFVSDRRVVPLVREIGVSNANLRSSRKAA
jgi:hypothetical protein